DDRRRQREARDDRRRNVPQEDEDDQDDEADRQEERELDVVNRVADGYRSIEPGVERHRRRQLLAQRRQQRLHGVDDGDDVRAGLLEDRQHDRALALEPAGLLV